MASAPPPKDPSAEDDGGTAAPPAWRRVRPWVVFLAITAAGTTADLWTKDHVFRTLLNTPEAARRVARVRARMGDAHAARVLIATRVQRPLAAGVKLTLQTNPGVVFGLDLPGWLVAAASVAAVAMVGWFFLTSAAGALALHAALGCILGGALGNAYDRLIATVTLPGGAGTIRHQVRDFVNCAAWGYPWVFNVADALLVVGVGLLVVHCLWDARRRRGDG
ncbi:MAG: signal peptidase II [Planctomycetota bacterium]